MLKMYSFKIIILLLNFILLHKGLSQNLDELSIKINKNENRIYVESSFQGRETFIVNDSVSAIIGYLSGFAPNLVEIKGQNPDYLLKVDFNGNDSLNSVKKNILNQILQSFNIKCDTISKEVDIWYVKKSNSMYESANFTSEDFTPINSFLKFNKKDIFVFDEKIDKNLLIPSKSLKDFQLLKDFLHCYYGFEIIRKKSSINFLLVDLTNVKNR